jgi:putative ABC transport system ATP-binding protein
MVGPFSDDGVKTPHRFNQQRQVVIVDQLRIAEDLGLLAKQLIDGVDVHARGEPQRTLFRRRHIGFVFQFFNLIPTLTVGENIRLPMELTDMSPGSARDRAHALLDQVGLPDMADRYPETLSGGEQQRTAVARALAHRPKILLADEPTGNLDEVSGSRVISLLTGLARDQGTTMLVVTHSRSVARAADRILHLRHGRLTAD